MFIKKNRALALVALTTTVVHAGFFTDFDNHFKQFWSSFEQDISTATKNGSLSINSSYDNDKNAVTVKVTIPGLTEKDIDFNLEDNKMVLNAKNDGHESLVIITSNSILVEQKEYEELTNKKGKVYTFTTGHNRVVNSLPREVVLSEALAEYENGVLTLTLPSAAKKVAIPIVYKGDTRQDERYSQAEASGKHETKKIIINSKKNKIVEQPVETETKQSHK